MTDTNENVVIITDDTGNEREVPLLDVNAVLTEHLKETIVETARGAMVFRTIPYSALKEVQQRHYTWLKAQGETGVAENQRIIDRRDAGETLSPEEEQFLREFAISSFPYSTDIIHAMLIKPAMSLKDFRSIIQALPREDWIRVQETCMGILQETYLDIRPKN